jgi:hypothetical protein
MVSGKTRAIEFKLDRVLPMKVKIFSIFSLLLLFSGLNAVQAAESRFIKVEQSQKNRICMVKNYYIPAADFSDLSVTIGDKTYFGCCLGCKQSLSNSAKHHFAYYSVDGKEVKVDKAIAGCILADREKKRAVHYFNSDKECDDFVKNPDSYSFIKSSEHQWTNWIIKLLHLDS